MSVGTLGEYLPCIFDLVQCDLLNRFYRPKFTFHIILYMYSYCCPRSKFDISMDAPWEGMSEHTNHLTLTPFSRSKQGVKMTYLQSGKKTIWQEGVKHLNDKRYQLHIVPGNSLIQ